MWRYRRGLGVISSSIQFSRNLSSGFFANGGFAKPILRHHRCGDEFVESASVFASPFRYGFSAFPYFCCSYSTSISGGGAYGCGLHVDEEEDDDFEGIEGRDLGKNEKDVVFDSGDLETIMGILQEYSSSTGGIVVVKDKLEHCGIRVTSRLVAVVLSRVRNDWEAAYTFFLWAGKQTGYAHSVREYHCMIAILGKMRKYHTAWNLIDQMRGGKNGNGPSLVTPQTILIMIRRYSAIHDVGKAISTFYALKRFKFEIGMEDFQNLLSALCRYKNVKDAEHLLFCNKSYFPLNTKSFNIILNGWCNIVCDLHEANRIWKEMKFRGIPHDVYSFSSLMSCYSKYGKLQDVLKLFDRMKVMETVADRKVYNAVIHALAKAKHVNEARNLMKVMEENGISPDGVTYTSIIMPLCRNRQFVEARQVFDELMMKSSSCSISPTVTTFHAFLRICRTGEEVFKVLETMKKTGCDPGHDTYIMLIRKFCRWKQIDVVFKLWNDMKKNGLSPDRSSYIVLVHGLFLNGKLEESYQYYLEMKRKHFLPEPKTEKMLQVWLDGKQNVLREESCQEMNKFTNRSCKIHTRKRDFLQQPETRKVTREGGFSFLE